MNAVFAVLIAAMLAVLAVLFVGAWLGWCHYTWNRDQLARLQASAAGHNQFVSQAIARYGAEAFARSRMLGMATLKRVRTGALSWEWRVEYAEPARKGGPVESLNPPKGPVRNL